jgi:hypothetical protein
MVTYSNTLDGDEDVDPPAKIPRVLDDVAPKTSLAETKFPKDVVLPVVAIVM